MLSRRSFLYASTVLLASRLAQANAVSGAAVLFDLDFADPRSRSEHAKVFSGALRYVDHEVFGDAAGIVIEDAAVNGVQDAIYANVGDVPEGWLMPSQFVVPMPSVVSFSRRGAGEGSLRIQGAGAGDFYVTLGSGKFFPIASGEAITGSLATRFAGGSLANVKNIALLVIENDAGGRVSNTSPSVAKIQQLQSDKPWWAQVSIVTGDYRFANLAIKIAAAGPFDIVLDIDKVQLEKRAFRSTFCGASRSADDVKLNAESAGAYLSGSRSLVITADAPRVGMNASLWREFSDKDNFIELQLRGHELYACCATGGVNSEMRLGVLPPLMRFSVALAVADGVVTASLNCKPPKSIRGNVPSGLNAVNLGGGVLGKWNSTIKRVTICRGVILDAAMESRRDQVFFDDFDRPDGPSMGLSPTGQSIARTGNVETKIVSRKWVANDGGLGLRFAAYGKVTLPNEPRYMGMVATWTSGTPGGAAGLIAATNNLTDPTDALHTIVGDPMEIFQTITRSKVDEAFAYFIYPSPMKRDGATPYGAARLFNARENAVVFVGPQGDLPRHVSPEYGKKIGKTAVFEHFWQLTQCRPEFLAVAAS
jgi:hypothetical protein